MAAEDDELVRLPDVAKQAGLGVSTLWSAIKEGLITPAPVRKRHNTQTFTREDAEFILTAAAIALAAGVAFLAVVRVLKAIDNAGVKIPAAEVNLNT